MPTTSENKELQKMTKWANEPTLSDLKQNYDDARGDHDIQITKIKEWANHRNVTGAAAIKKREGRSQVQPKLIRKQAEWRYSSLSDPFLSTPDLFNVYPVTAKDVKRARQNQLVLNYQFNTQIDKEHFIDSYVHSAVDDGTVIVKVGWETLEEEQTREEPIYAFTPDVTGQYAQQYMQLLALQKADPETFETKVDPGFKQGLERFLAMGESTIPRLIGHETKTEMVEVVNRPILEILRPENVVIDPACKGRIKHAQFVIYSFETNKAALNEDGRYKNIDAINVAGNSPLAHPDHETTEDLESYEAVDDTRKAVVAYEYWGFWDIDGNGTTKPIVATWVGDTLIRLEENPMPDKELPFVVVPYLFKSNSVYGEPDAELLIDNQKIIGAVTRGMIDLMGRSANSQTGMQKGLLDTYNKRRYLAGQDYEFNGQGRDPRQGIFTHVYPEIPQSAFSMVTLQQNEAESITGVKAYNTGISGEALGETNGLGRSALDAASKRELAILRRLAKGVRDIGRKIIAMNAEWMNDTEIIRITDDEFVPVRRDDLAGKFDLRLSISTAEEDNAKAQELAFMLQTVGPNDDPAIRRMIQADIARLRKMPELADRIEKYQPKPDPIVEQQRQLELLLLQAQVQKELALAKSYGADAEGTLAQIQETYSKIQLNIAKARDLGATTDQRNLDFLEQDQGVKQERDLQKIERQAEAQSKLKIVEAALNPQPKQKAA